MVEMGSGAQRTMRCACHQSARPACGSVQTGCYPLGTTSTGPAPNRDECVDVLETLQVQLFQELDTNQRLMLEIQDMKLALRLAKDELAGTQAGERRARHRASHDSLTLLGNRGFFGKHLEKAHPNGRALCINEPEVH
jgi:hypothetical protein